MSQHISINVIYGMKFDSDLLDEVLSDHTLDLIYGDNLKDLDAIVTDYNEIFVGKIQYYVTDLDSPINESFEVIDLTDEYKSEIENNIEKAFNYDPLWPEYKSLNQTNIKLHVVIQYG